jgi:glutamate synthase domain-containing protein 2
MNMFIPAEYEVVRDKDLCINCRLCEKQCANEVHKFDKTTGKMTADSNKCVNCHRCVCMCPTHALKIVKSDDTYRINANWSVQTMNEVYRQANSGGVLLSSMGNPNENPVYFNKILLNASQVTNPPIDPLREPMETVVYLGKKDVEIKRDIEGKLIDTLPPQLKLQTPIMFSAMSYGSISYNAHEALARAAEELGIFYNTGEGGLHRDFYKYGKNTIVQVASGRFGVHEEYLKTAAAIEIKMGQGAKPGIGGHLPGMKISDEVSKTRMIPKGIDAISPAPHHDIYSIEDLRQLIYTIKEATSYTNP